MIKLTQRGSFTNTEKFLKHSFGTAWRRILKKYGQMGVEALSAATPVDTGLTAASWSYELIQNKDGIGIEWRNDNVVDHVNIAVILQYGHATRNGGWVKGRDYINPALQPIFDNIAKESWKEVRNTL